MIQLWSAVAVALLTIVLGPAVRGELSDRLVKRLSAHAELREKIAEVPGAVKELDALLTAEVSVLRRREEFRLTRKLNGPNVAAVIFVALFGGGGVYLLVSGGITVGGGVAVALYICAGIWGLFFVGLAAVGSKTLYDPPKEAKPKKPK